MKENETEEKLIAATKEWLEKGYLLYLYLSCATGKYEWKPVDPKYYSNTTLENFRNKYAVNHKLYDNIEDMLSDRKELNSGLVAYVLD